MGVLAVHPTSPRPVVPSMSWTTEVEVREFLTSRRAKITPEQAGLPAAGQRRVPGLRRSEVAALAGMSVEYYAKLERGSLAGVSAGVLDALARALQLDDAERAHLLRLAHEADGSNAVLRPRRRPKQWTVRPSLQWSLDAITAPAILGNDRLDLLAANHLGRAMYSDLYADPTSPPNFARFTFLDSAARRFYPDWDLAADMTVANLRTAAGKDPHDKALHDLVGELSTRSDDFRRRWGAHNVRTHGSRRQALPPPRRRRPHPRLREHGPARRARPHPDHLHRRARLADRARAHAARLLGGHSRPRHVSPATLGRLPRRARNSSRRVPHACRS